MSTGGGAFSALEYVGIPRSWLNKRPKLPSRNWLIFLGLSSSLTAAYVYDRRECKRIKQAYIERVQHLADNPLAPWELPRKVIVYTTKWPGDDDYERGAIHFKTYMKPILNAAAIDYEIVLGKRHGDLAANIAAKIKAQRRIDAKLDPSSNNEHLFLQQNTHKERKEKQQREGAIVLVGRSTLKEFMHGFRAGWKGSIARIDEDEQLAEELSGDGVFDEEEREDSVTLNPLAGPNLFLGSPSTTLKSGRQPAEDVPAELDRPPDTIPRQPPILLLSFLDRIGFSQIPLMIVDWFSRREQVRAGGEAALALIRNLTRPMSTADLGWDQGVESYYKSSLKTLPDDVEKSRKKYYEELPKQLNVARALSRREREPTKDEIQYPPPTEVELRAKRFEMEQSWRKQLSGWEIVRPEAPVAWEDNFDGSLTLLETADIDSYGASPSADR